MDSLTTCHASFLGINPYKLFIGLPNIAFEKQLTRHVSAFAFAEYLVPEQRIQPNGHEHPKFVIQLSARGYFSSQNLLSGFYAGMITGLKLKDQGTGQYQGVLVGIEGGYKLLPGKRKWFYLEPRLLSVLNLGQPIPIEFGAELHIGLRMGK